MNDEVLFPPLTFNLLHFTSYKTFGNCHPWMGFHMPSLLYVARRERKARNHFVGKSIQAACRLSFGNGFYPFLSSSHLKVLLLNLALLSTSFILLIPYRTSDPRCSNCHEAQCYSYSSIRVVRFKPFCFKPLIYLSRRQTILLAWTEDSHVFL